jgi:hypothetical protein
MFWFNDMRNDSMLNAVCIIYWGRNEGEPMMQAQVHPTSLGTIREFLAGHGCAPAPWATPKEVVSALHKSLKERRSDEAFWADLKNLAVRLEDRRFNETALRGSDALGGSTVDGLIEDLRTSLGDGSGNGGGANFKRWLGHSVGATALLAFLLLGTVIACGDDDDDDSSSAVCAEADAEGFEGDEADVYCELIEIIETSDIDETLKDELLECLPGLDATSREGLLDSFEGMTDDQIAEELDGAYWFVCDDDPYGDDDDH